MGLGLARKLCDAAINTNKKDAKDALTTQKNKVLLGILSRALVWDSARGPVINVKYLQAQKTEKKEKKSSWPTESSDSMGKHQNSKTELMLSLIHI